MTKQTKGGGGARWFYIGLAVVAVAGVAWLLSAGRIGGGDEPLPPLSVAETSGVTADPGAGTSVGPEDAPIVIWDFSDYLCPHCRTFNSMVGKLVRQNYAVPGGSVRWVSYEFPLSDRSVPATIAAHCAGEQGRYWEMHDMLFARVEAWATEQNPSDRFVELGGEIGLDKGAFRACLRERPGIAGIIASKKYGEQLGVTGTPTIFVNGELAPRTNQFYTYQGLEAFIRDFTAQAADAGGE